MKIVGITIGVFIAITAVGFAVKLIFFPVHVAEKEIQLAYDTVNKTLDSDNAIYNYEWFKQTHEDIVAIGNKLDNASIVVDNFKQEAGSRDNWTFEDKTEYSRLNSVKLGLQNHLEQVIANYNARSKMANRNIFENSILPGYVDALTFIKK